MKLDEAIEIKTKVINLEMPCWMPKALKADKLGVEAMKKEQRLRQLVRKDQICLLPGETKG